MLIEMAVGTAVSWLWGQLGKAAEDKDQQKALLTSLEKSINESFTHFQSSYPEFSESFFSEKFLKESICPEVLKFLTRSEHPDVERVVKALPDHAVLGSENEYRDEITTFFDMVMDSMKEHTVLQNIIDHRQIEETNQNVVELKEQHRSDSDEIKGMLESIGLDSKQKDEKLDQVLDILSRQSSNEGISSFITQTSETLPTKQNDALNTLLEKQLDQAKDFINSEQVQDAQGILNLIEHEVSEAGNYTRFRWHTSTAACLLAQDKLDEAAEQYFIAYNFEKNDEKAVANRIRAYLLLNNSQDALVFSTQAISEHPQSGMVWALHIYTLKQTGTEFDTTSLPEPLLEDESILLALSELKLNVGAFGEALNLAKAAYEKDPNKIMTKRLLLSIALRWATVDNIHSHFKHFDTEQRSALEFAVEVLSDSLSFLRKIQTRSTFIEIANNLSIALNFLNDFQESDKITDFALSIYPDEVSFIRNKVRSLNRDGNIDSIRSLTKNRLHLFDKYLLFSLAEISANLGDKDWHALVRTALHDESLDEKDHDELLGLEICCAWKSGDKNSAVELTERNKAKISSSAPLLSLNIRILDELGEEEQKNVFLDLCEDFDTGGSSHEIVEIADILYDYGRFFEASKYYAQLIDTQTDSYLTKRYLESLLRSDQRALVISKIEALPDHVRYQSQYQLLEANIARATGDLDKLEDILTKELEKNPTDSSVAIGYASTLYNKDKIEPLTEYLSSNPEFSPFIEDNEINFAKLQISFGFKHEGLLRLYNAFRANPNSSEVAGYYMMAFLMEKDLPILRSTQVTPGSVIYLESHGQKQCFVYEYEETSCQGGWPECIKPGDEVARKLDRLSIGDEVSLHTGLGLAEWTITSIDSMFIFGLNMAQSIVKKNVSGIGPIWSLDLESPDGDINISPLLESAKSRKQYVEQFLKKYHERILPLQMVSEAIGIDIVSLWLEWPYQKYDLLISSGRHDERATASELIATSSKRYVFDLSSLIELSRLGLLEHSLKITDQPFVPASVKEELVKLLKMNSKLNFKGTYSEENGHLSCIEYPDSHFKKREEFLKKLLQFIDEYCEIVPVIGPELISGKQVQIIELIGHASMDAINLALERDLILLSEDGGLRSYAFTLGLTSSTWLQPLLMLMRDRGILSNEKYSSIVVDKIKHRHSFTTIGADELIIEARLDLHHVSPNIRSVLESFRSATLDLPSGVQVCSDFLLRVAQYLSPDLLYQYYILILDVLTSDRDALKDQIQIILSAHIIKASAHMKRKKTNKIIKIFGNDLVLPEQRQIKVKTIVSEIKKALRSI